MEVREKLSGVGSLFLPLYWSEDGMASIVTVDGAIHGLLMIYILHLASEFRSMALNDNSFESSESL